MRARGRIAITSALMCAVIGTLCGAADATVLTQVERAYANGGIPACRFSAKELGAVLAQIPGDVAQYDADLIDAIHQALNIHAAGACNGGTSASAGLIGAGSGSELSVSLRVRPVGAATEAGVPAPLVILALLLALLAVGAVACGLARFVGLDPAWAARARHAFHEADFRVGQGWAKIADRMRIGR